MNFLQEKRAWSTLEIGMLKLCVGSIYLIVGVYFHQYLQPYLWIFGVLFLVLAVWGLVVWFKKPKIQEKINHIET